jgi:hypothetical protein
MTQRKEHSWNERDYKNHLTPVWVMTSALCRKHRVLTVTCLDACRCAAYLTELLMCLQEEFQFMQIADATNWLKKFWGSLPTNFRDFLQRLELSVCCSTGASYLSPHRVPSIHVRVSGIHMNRNIQVTWRNKYWIHVLGMWISYEREFMFLLRLRWNTGRSTTSVTTTLLGEYKDKIVSVTPGE